MPRDAFNYDYHRRIPRRKSGCLSRASLIAVSLLLLAAGLVSCFWRSKDKTTLAQREKQYAPLVSAAAAKHGISPSLVMAVIWKESRFRADRVGRKKEIGLMQLMDGAITDWAKAENNGQTPSRRQVFQPELNIEIGTWYLARAASHWKGYASQDILTLAEYNAGYSRVDQKWKPANKNTKVSLEQVSFPGTRDYIMQILQKRNEYDSQ